jgi:hypothetical protein
MSKTSKLEQYFIRQKGVIIISLGENDSIEAICNLG